MAIKRVAMFFNLPEGDRDLSMRREAFLQGLGSISELHVAERFGAAQYVQYGQRAKELNDLNPDVFFAACWPTFNAVMGVKAQNTPVVFAGMFDASDDPTKNTAYNDPSVYGFISYGVNLCKQWPGLLLQVAPNVKRVGIVFDKSRQGQPQLVGSAIRTACVAAGLQMTDIADIDASSANLKQAIVNFANAASTPAGLIVAASTLTATRRQDIFDQVENLKLPAIYPNRIYTMHVGNGNAGGLISRGTYLPDFYRSAGHYANQILNKTPPNVRVDFSQTGSNPSFETVVNLRAAKAINLSVPTSVTDNANLVIE
jgi:putative ABC transport system substrate-binding protein